MTKVLTWNGENFQEIEGDYVSVRDFNASGSSQSTTGSINADSNQLTLASAIDFKNGQGINIAHAGATITLSTPTTLTVTPTGGTGSTSYTYAVAAIDANGGVTAVKSTSIANGYATLSSSHYNALSVGAVTNAIGYAWYRTASGGTPNTIGLIGVTTGTSLNDTGLSIATAPSDVPTNAPSSALNGRLVTTILAGAGTTTLTLKNNAVNTVNGTTIKHDDTAAIQAAIDDKGTLYFPDGSYLISSEIIIPQASTMKWLGSGFRKVNIYINAIAINGFNYTRASGQSGSILSVSNIAFYEWGYNKTSTAIKWWGYDQTLIDNWLRMTDCYLNGLNYGVNLKYAGQCHFVGIWGQKNNFVFYLGRAASFLYFERCMSLVNTSMIHADDTAAGGISNGISMFDCHSVFCSGIDVRIYGWQVVNFIGCSFDLGGGGVANVYLNSCQDFRFDNCWIASDITNAPSRHGIQLVSCHSGSISNCSIVNNNIGVRIDGSTSFATKLNIHGNKFAGNTNNDILMIYGVAVKITNNSFCSTPNHLGTNYEVYGNTTGSDKCIVQFNTFVCASYSIIIGSSSIIGNNIFNVQA